MASHSPTSSSSKKSSVVKSTMSAKKSTPAFLSIDGEEIIGLSEMPSVLSLTSTVFSKEEAVEALKGPGGILTTFADTAKQRDRLAIKKGVKFIKDLELDYSNKSNVAYEASLRATREKEKVGTMQDEVNNLLRELEQVKGMTTDEAAATSPTGSRFTNSKMKEKIKVLEFKLNTAQERLEMQRVLAKQEYAVELLAIKEKDLAALNLHRVQELAREMETRETREIATNAMIAEERAKQERIAIKRMEAKRLAKGEALKNSMAETKEHALEQIKASQVALKKGKQRMKVITASTVPIEAVAAELEKSKYDERATAFMSLKKNTDKARADMIGKNERRAKIEAKRLKAEEEEAASILAAGGNPYEVFRQRRLAEDEAAQIAKLEKRQRDEELRIATRMISEDEHVRKHDREETRDRRYKEKYQSEMGRGAKEERVKEYMISKTRGGTEHASLTGTEKVQPSTVTTIKDHSFGLGIALDRPDVIEKVKSKPVNKSVEPNALFIPKGVDTLSATNAAKRAGDLEGTVELPTVDPPGLAIPFNETATDVPTGFMGVGEDSGAGVSSLASSSAAKWKKKSSTVNAEDDSKRFPPPKLSVLEQKMMEAARVRQRENIIQKQVVWGKEFEGRAFLAKPEEIIFEDFTVNVPMTISFTLTNVSHTFNNFKLGLIADEFRDFFEITYTKPGRMSAGMTCTLTIVFSPKLNKDIITEIPFVAKTGAFSVPLKCLTKKALPKVTHSSLDLGLIVMGESGSATLEIVNEGALDVDFFILEVETKAATSPAPHERLASIAGLDSMISMSDMLEAEEATTSNELLYHNSGTAGMFSRCQIPFKYTPAAPGDLKKNYLIRFANGSCSDVSFSITARCVKVPIYVDEPVMDFKCCIIDTLYRSRLILRNRGTVALKCMVSPPPELKGCLEFIPDLGFVQAFNATAKKAGSFEIQVKFRPNAETLKRCEAFLSSSESSIIRVPIRVDVPDQTLPVFFDLEAQLSSGGIEFTPPSIDFGQAYISQSLIVPLKMRNLSALPQKFGFVHLPNYISVLENEGFGTLLPFETLERSIVFSPPAAKNYTASLHIKTSLNRSFTIHCSGEGATQPLHFSESIIKFCPTAVGNRVEHSVIVSNRSKYQQTFEFGIPQAEAAQIKISPVVETLASGASCRVVVEFIPTTQPEEPRLDDAGASGLAGASTTVMPKSHEGSIVETSRVSPPPSLSSTSDMMKEPPSRHCSWKIPCFTTSSHGISTGGKAASKGPLLCLEVHTTTVKQEVYPESSRIDFGEISVGKAELISIRVKNTTASEVMVHNDTLNCLGPFTLLNTCKPIPAGGTIPLVLQFKPEKQRMFNETLTLFCDKGNMDIVLVGEGVSPKFTIDPADGQLDLGHVVAGGENTATFKIKNSSAFPLIYSIDPIGLQHTNYAHNAIFTCVPGEGSILAGKEQVITVTFAPDHERQVDYVTEFHLNVPNQAEMKKLVCRGHCWTRQTFLIAAPEDRVSIPEKYAVEDVFAIPMGLGLEDVSAVKPATAPITVTFPKEDPSATKFLYVGSALALKGGSAGSFEIKLPDASPFSIDPIKGSTVIGKPTKLAIKIKPEPAVAVASDLIGGLRVGQWIETVGTCSLKGGFVPLGAPAEETVTIILRRFVDKTL